MKKLWKNLAFRIFLLVAVVALVAAGGGVVYLQAASGDGGEEGQEATADAESADTENVDGEAENEEDGEEDDAVPVRVTEVGVGTVSTYISSTANLVPEDEVRVLAEAEGRVTRLEVEEGDFVRKGQLLATLHRDEAEIAVQKAELKATNARLAYERAEKMSAENLIAREEFDKLTMDHRIAQQELAEAEWRLAKTEIRAPFGGRLTRRDVTLGQHIRPGDELFTVTDFDPLIARIYLPEKDVMALEEGREVGIGLKADENVEFRGRIRQISPVVDTATGTVKVTVEAVQPPASVRPGCFVTVDITRETREGTLVLPKEAVVRELKKAHVFVAAGDLAEKRDVELGLEEGAILEIVAGLEAGESIVVAGQGGLKNGAKIRVLPDEDGAVASAEDAESDHPVS
jgi:membrane fusion protein (multidrug efflux system)